MARVLVVYGSEGGVTKEVAENLSKAWAEKQDTKFKISSEALSGNDAAHQFETLKEEHDVLLVLTSSFGEGDPPDNFVEFLLELLKGANHGTRPLEGMQHAVLGFGDSNYETFMNCPRLSDKLLEECGSRRIHKRHEIDAGVWEDKALAEMRKAEEDWKDNVYKVLQAGPKASDKPAAPWCEEGKTDKIYPKSESDLSGSSGGGGAGVFMAIGAIVVAAGAFLWYQGM